MLPRSDLKSPYPPHCDMKISILNLFNKLKILNKVNKNISGLKSNKNNFKILFFVFKSK